MPIPKIIIQTHKDPSISANCRQTWINFHSDYVYRFFNDAECRQFFIDKMPSMLASYDKLPLPVQKADLFRYAAIYFYGGIYADVDTICLAPVHTYIDMNKDHLVVGVEMTPAIFKEGIDNYVTKYHSPSQILQWNFAASAKHPALGKLLSQIKFLLSLNSYEEIISYSQNIRFTLELTGPMCFSQVLYSFLSVPRESKVTILPQLTWGYHPIENNDISLPNPNIKALHLYHGSWKT
jgi:mannosyltransferase OCH1-like enzyme